MPYVQQGALAHAHHEGIEVVISAESQPLPAFSITALRYDPAREQRLRNFLVAVVDTATARDSAAGVVVRPDGTKE
jgi:hypothetical protein